MTFAQITPLLITFNEEPNIGRALEKLRWASRIVVIDSGSTDRTATIVSHYPQAEIIYRPFDSFAEQCNFGLTQIRTPWVLSLDGDYVLSDALIEELKRLDLSGEISAYSARFSYVVHGQPLRGTLYPPRKVLYKLAHARYQNEGHGHRVSVEGAAGALTGVIYHDDRKPLSRWFSSQQRYAAKEADYLLAAGHSELKLQDRIRRMIWPAPFLVFFYTLLAKGCLFDGWRGWFYVLQRVIAECMLAVELLDRRLAAKATQSAPAAQPMRSEQSWRNS